VNDEPGLPAAPHDAISKTSLKSLSCRGIHKAFLLA
jgi:hypothetical protein